MEDLAKQINAMPTVGGGLADLVVSAVSAGPARDPGTTQGLGAAGAAEPPGGTAAPVGHRATR
jgi:hypothetical protein